MEYKLLTQIEDPSDLKRIPEDQLPALCAEIRHYLIDSISKTGGHLASNLGTVELTVALHRIFDSPKDKFVFDVGHQCYTHKLLTGRREAFSTLRKKDGISGFPKPNESVHDAFIAGHSSTSISAAYGIAKAFALEHNPHFVVACIGDGALTGGEAYEALNNAGPSKTRLIVIINHNDMSISKNVGAFARYLSNIRSTRGYINMKRRVDSLLNKTPLVGKPLKELLERSKALLKAMLYRSTFFEDMGFGYLGPVDGHDLTRLEEVLQRAKEMEAPVVIQVETKKGKGYPYAEQNPGAYHAIGEFDVLNGGDDAIQSECYSNETGLELTRLAEEDGRICAITAAMKYGTGLHTFYAAHKDRFFDVGIAEPHAVTFAGGLASQGMIPVFCVYSTFLQRSYDQILHDLAISEYHVVLCVDRAGLVGEDGETHQGIFDAAFLSSIPGTVIYSPEGYEELRLCIAQAVQKDWGIACVRYPRGKEKRAHSLAPTTEFQYIGQGRDTLVISYGRIFSECFAAARTLAEKGRPVSLLKLTKIHPIPAGALEIAAGYSHILFVEEGIRTGGIGEQFGVSLLEKGIRGTYRIAAIDDCFVTQGDIPSLLEMLGLDAQGIGRRIESMEHTIEQ